MCSLIAVAAVKIACISNIQLDAKELLCPYKSEDSVCNPIHMPIKKGKANSIAFPGYSGLRSARGYPGADSPDYKETAKIVYLTGLASVRAFGPKESWAPDRKVRDQGIGNGDKI